MLWSALVLLLAVASPAPLSLSTAPTPPPEPNHITLDAVQSAVKTASSGWQNTKGASSQLSGRYEFQATAQLRFNNTLHWERMSSTWTDTYGAKTVTVPYNYNLYDDELSVEVGHPEYPFGIGVGYYDYASVYDGGSPYTMQGLGAGIDQWTNYYLPRSLYYSAWYYPNLRNSNPAEGRYDILRAELGINMRASLVSPWNVKIGIQSESWFARKAPAADMWIVGPYVSLSYWK